MMIDITRLAAWALGGKLATGIERVSLEYARHFGARARALLRTPGRWVAFGSRDSRLVFESLLAAKGSRLDLLGTIARGYALGWQPPMRSILLNADYNGREIPGYAARLRRRGLRPVFFVHDMIPFTSPEFCRLTAPLSIRRCLALSPAARRELRRREATEALDSHHRRMRAILAAAAGIVVSTEDTRRALERYAAAAGLACPRCTAAPLAAARLPQPSPASPLAHPYFVALSTIQPRKNHILLLRLWRYLIEELGDASPRLVLIGRRGWKFDPEADLLDRCERMREFVIEREHCEDAELSTWLRHARALLFPTFCEGYGMPLVEALGLGVPVIASDLAVFREIAGAVPDYLHPLDGPGWKRAILDYSRLHATRRDEQLERMAGFRAPAWSDHFRRVEALLESLEREPGAIGESLERAPREAA